MPNAKSILVMAYPQYITKLGFQYMDKVYSVIIPHTYRHSEVYDKVENILSSILKPNYYSYIGTYLPVKLLAVTTGLGMYGRNNICYVEGMGSFLRLFSFYTDIPYSGDGWTEKTAMPECKTCSACMKVCPTGCINENRFLINAERCISNFNEKEGDFPAWMDGKWHNAIVGCMKCQAICPQNKNFIDKVDNEVMFVPEETEMILKNVPFTQLPDQLKQKINGLDLTQYYEVLHRNLSFLIR
jgi:epoxyqueuosine reductase